MRYFSFLKKRKEEPDPRPGLCHARTGLSTFCMTSVSPGQHLCDFHKNLAGPWSKPDQVFEKFSRQ